MNTATKQTEVEQPNSDIKPLLSALAKHAAACDAWSAFLSGDSDEAPRGTARALCGAISDAEAEAARILDEYIDARVNAALAKTGAL